MKIKAVILTLIISFFTLKSGLVMSYYIIFTDSFIENYCVNKDKPELKCDGKCFLSELLEKNSTENESQEKMMLISSSELVFYFNPVFNEISDLSLTVRSKSVHVIPYLYTFDFSKKQLKPPKSLV
jgi:hypothetical protein